MHHIEDIADGQPERSYQTVRLAMVKKGHMSRWGIIFLIITLITAALSFGGLAGTAAGATKTIFVVGIILFLINLFTGRKRPQYVNRKEKLLLSQSIGLTFTVLASGDSRYFVALLQRQQEDRGGTESARHAR